MDTPPINGNHVPGLKGRLMRLKIRTKLLFINILVIAIFAIILLGVFLAFSHVRNMLTDTLVGDVQKAVTNAHTGVELSKLFAQTNEFLNTYYVDRDAFDENSSELRAGANELLKTYQAGDLTPVLERFRHQLDALLMQCRLVNTKLMDIQKAEDQILEHVDELDKTVAQAIIDMVLEGMDPDAMQQIATLASGFRESLLLISKTRSDHWPEHFYASRTPADEVSRQLDDLLLRVRTLSASTPPVARYAALFIQDIDHYRVTHTTLHAVAFDLKALAEELGLTMHQALEGMEAMDQAIMATSANLEREIAKATGRTSLMLVLLAAGLVILLSVATIAFVQSNLRRPMNSISQGLRAISAGDFNTTLDLGRHDEWAEIEQAINSMAMSLATYYAEIQENRAEIEQAYTELKRAEEQYRTIADYNYDLEGWIGPQGEMLYVSPSCERITGYPRDRFIKDPDLLHQIIHRDDVNLWQQHMSDASDTGGEGADFRIFRRDGRMRWISQVTRLVPGDKGIRFSMRDITDRKFMERQLEYESLHDPLTGLSNRVLCLDRIRQTLERGKRHPDTYFAVVFMDLDRFKLINDSLGHSFGDKLLIETSTRLLKCVREVDTVSRFGGDEFILLLEDLSLPREGIRTVKRVRDVFHEPFHIEGHNIPISASFGVVLSPTGTTNPEEILQNANIAMHRAKESGRDRIKVFNSRMLDQAQGQMTLENDLRAAITNREFHLLFQPIFSLNKRGLTGFECLTRWDHPTRGVVSPGEFIPVAEASGLIVDLGLWVLEDACRTYVAWLNRYPSVGDLTMSVNVSSRQFARHDLVEQVEEVLETTGMPPASLKLEITETSIMEYAGNVVGKLYRLKDLGILVSIDDFGTGYSSMAYLQKFPLDNLKIDLSFVNMLDSSPENVEIVRAIITLAHSLGLEVVAEGVEKKEHLEILCALDCEYGQGYYFSKPMSRAVVEDLLAHPEKVTNFCNGVEACQDQTKKTS